MLKNVYIYFFSKLLIIAFQEKNLFVALNGNTENQKLIDASNGSFIEESFRTALRLYSIKEKDFYKNKIKVENERISYFALLSFANVLT